MGKALVPEDVVLELLPPEPPGWTIRQTQQMLEDHAAVEPSSLEEQYVRGRLRRMHKRGLAARAVHRDEDQQPYYRYWARLDPHVTLEQALTRTVEARGLEVERIEAQPDSEEGDVFTWTIRARDE